METKLSFLIVLMAASFTIAIFSRNPVMFFLAVATMMLCLADGIIGLKGMF